MRVWIVLLLGITAFLTGSSILVADDLKITLEAPNAAAEWSLLDKSARISSGELILDGRQKISRAVYLPRQWGDVTLTAKFLVEPQPEGVLACGFMVRVADGSRYYYVHFDRGQAILVRHSQANGWHEIKSAERATSPA